MISPVKNDDHNERIKLNEKTAQRDFAELFRKIKNRNKDEILKDFIFGGKTLNNKLVVAERIAFLEKEKILSKTILKRISKSHKLELRELRVGKDQENEAIQNFIESQAQTVENLTDFIFWHDGDRRQALQTVEIAEYRGLALLNLNIITRRKLNWLLKDHLSTLESKWGFNSYSYEFNY